MDTSRRGRWRLARPAWVVAALALLVAVVPCVGDEPPEVGAPKPDEPWREEAEDLERRAGEAESTQDHRTALDLRRAVVALLSAKRPESRELAFALNEMARTLHALGRTGEALPLFEEALAMRRRLFPGDHPDVAQGLNNLALALKALGRTDEALPLYEQALATWRRLYPGDHPDVARGLNNVAATLASLSRADEALSLHQEALAMRRRLFPGDHAEVAQGLNNLALVHFSQGRAAEALPLFQEALAMWRRLHPDDHPDVALGLTNLAGTLGLLGRVAEALPHGEAALAMRRRLHPGDHPQVAQSLHALAHVLEALGRATEALRLLVEALAIRRKAFPGDHPDVAQALNGLAATLQSLGRSAEALPLLEESLAMRRRLSPGDHPEVARGLSNLGSTLGALGRAGDALPLKEEALAMRRRLFPGDHKDVALSLNNVAFTLGALGRGAEALALYEQALAMRRRLHPGDHRDVALGLNNVARVLHSLGRTAEALPLNEESLAMWRRLFSGDHPDVALAMNNLADVLRSLGRTDEALRLREQAFEMAVALGSPDRWRWGTNLGALRIRLGHVADAVEPLQVAVETLEALRSDARGLRAEERSQLVGSMREWADPYAFLVVAHGALGRRAEALEVLERGRGREMLDVLRRGQVDPVEQARARAEMRGDREARQRIDAAVRERIAAEAEVLRVERELQQARGRRGDVRALVDAEPKARREFLAALSGVERLVRDEVPGARPLSAREVQALLAPDERLLAYSLADGGSRGFVVGPESLEMFELAAEGLEAAVEGYAEALAKPHPDPASELASAGRRLFEQVLPRAAWENLRGAKRLYLMADGPLHRIPFEALVVGEAEGKPLHWAEAGPPIAYEPSGSVLSWLLSRPRAVVERADLVAVGDPLFAGSAPPVAWPTTGVLVTEVRPGGQAERIGLRPGDVLVAYDGKELADGASLRAAIQAAGTGRTDVPVGYLREGVRGDVASASGPLGVSIANEPPDVSGPKLLAGGHLEAALRSARERGKRLKPLPGTRHEVEAIRSTFRAALGERVRVATLLGNDAREERLFEATHSPRVLHLATHGLADETETASFSSLALTMPAIPVPGDDGFLTLVDLFSRWRGRLEGTDLVVLSACESTKGRQQKAEGMYALPWGFLYAGARAVIGSLWKVDDESTAFLMGEFYRHYLETGGTDPLGALAAARRATKAKYPHPAHWAPFVFTGAPR